MKVAVFSESPVDEAAIRILVDALLGEETEVPKMPPLRSRGHDAVLASLHTVLKHLHFRTDTDALVVVMDSDRSPVHEKSRDQAGKANANCRLCRLRSVIDGVKCLLSPRSHREPLKIAVGLAVPQLEAWFRCGIDRQVSEATWLRVLQNREFPYDGRRLKRDVYGHETPLLATMMPIAIKHARRLAQPDELVF